ncbi:MAG TPA: hypothetical protein VII01_00530, partial [Solirubrobacteraceae bacterium]
MFDLDLEELVVVARRDSLFFRFSFFMPADAAHQEGVDVDFPFAQDGRQFDVDAKLKRNAGGLFQVVDGSFKRFRHGWGSRRDDDREFLFARFGIGVAVAGFFFVQVLFEVDKRALRQRPWIGADAHRQIGPYGLHAVAR